MQAGIISVTFARLRVHSGRSYRRCYLSKPHPVSGERRPVEIAR